MRFTKRCDDCPALVLWAREEIRRRKKIENTKRSQAKRQSKEEKEMLKKLLGDEPEKKVEKTYPVETPGQRCPKCGGSEEKMPGCNLCGGTGKYRRPH